MALVVSRASGALRSCCCRSKRAFKVDLFKTIMSTIPIVDLKGLSKFNELNNSSFILDWILCSNIDEMEFRANRFMLYRIT